MSVTIRLSDLKDLIFISSIIYNIYLNHVNTELMNKNMSSLIESNKKIVDQLGNLKNNIDTISVHEKNEALFLNSAS